MGNVNYVIGEMSLGDRLNSSQLKSFAINGLFGFKDIKIPFDKEALILIAENGAGKTTILNTLYYSISCQFQKLSAVDFESVVLEFVSGDSVEIEKSDLISFYNLDREPLPSIELSVFELEKAITMTSRTREEHLQLNRKLAIAYRKSKINKITKTIEQNLNESILYFPTYRRIEEELKNLGYEKDKLEQLSLDDGEGKLIQFGMNDVRDKLNEIKTDIKKLSTKSFFKSDR